MLDKETGQVCVQRRLLPSIVYISTEIRYTSRAEHAHTER